MSFMHQFPTIVAAAVFLTASTALAEDQMVAQMACQQELFGEKLPRVLVITQAEADPDVARSLAPKNNDKVDFDDVPFKIEARFILTTEF